MTLESLTYIALPDVPPTKDMGLYHFLMQLKIILEQMSGRVDDNKRIVTYEDLIDLGLI